MMSLATGSWEGESNDETEPGELPKNGFYLHLASDRRAGDYNALFLCRFVYCEAVFLLPRFSVCGEMMDSSLK